MLGKRTPAVPALAATLLVAALGSSPGNAADRALLIGVEAYRSPEVPPTPGCVADARATAEFLKKRFGFADHDIKILVNEQATSAAIVKQIQDWLITPTQPGDRVFLFYAGHGSQLPDDNGDEQDGFDETLAPWDVDIRGSGAGQIRDDVLEPLISQLAGRRAVCVFDCCHSGTIPRGMPRLGAFPRGGGARYLPRPDQLRALLEAPGAGGQGYVVGPAGSRNLRVVDPLIASSKGGSLPGVVIVSAAKPHQQAFPLPVGGVERGALSYIFASVQEGRLPTVRELRSLIPQRVRELQSSGQLDGDQEPVIEVLSQGGIDDAPVFGTWEQGPEVALQNTVSPIQLSLVTEDGRSRYRIGEKAHLKVTSNTPGHLYLVAFSANDVATCIFPSARFPENQVRAGAAFRYTVPAQEPAGRDVIVAILTQSPLKLGERERYTHQEVYSRLNLNGLRSAVSTARAAPGSQLVSTPSAGPAPREWQTALLALETTR